MSAGAGFPWLQVGATVLGSGVVAALATHALAVWDAHRGRHRESRDTALRAAVQLEEFAHDASDTASSALRFEPYSDDREPLAAIPEAPDLSKLNWQPVAPHLSGAALGFAREVSLAVNHGAEVFNIDADEGVQARLDHALALGLRAWDIAAQLRKHYRIDKGVSVVGGGDFVVWMREEVEKQAHIREHNARTRLEPIL